MNKIFLIVLSVCLMLALCGCKQMDEVPKQEDKDSSSMLMVFESFEGGKILVDRDTNVLYWMSTGCYNNGNLTLLVDENGSPKILECR